MTLKLLDEILQLNELLAMPCDVIDDSHGVVGHVPARSCCSKCTPAYPCGHWHLLVIHSLESSWSSPLF